MGRSRVDTSLVRVTKGDFAFPLGVSPVEEVEPAPGYTAHFEPADGDDDEGQWEEWPDRYVFDALITATRLEALCRSLFALLPGRVYPILDILGGDAYREVDPYIAYDLVGFDRFADSLRRHRGWLYEDGLVGFGAMSLEPFVYVFVDEHKYVTIRVQTDLRERVEGILQAFDLAAVAEPRGADTALHEHRSVIDAPADRPDLLTFEEIVEELVEDWRLRLNVDHATNVDDDGRDLGITGWRCIVRRSLNEDEEAPAYAEVLLAAASLDEAERLAFDAVLRIDERASDQPSPGSPRTAGEAEPPDEDPAADEATQDYALVAADRVTPEDFAGLLLPDSAPGSTPTPPPSPPTRSEVLAARWLG